METLNQTQISTSDATSCVVKTARDESVGSIKDFVLNSLTGEVDYVVLKVDDGFLNLGSKLLALPYESFEFHTAQEDVVIVKESKETLENAPGFDSEHRPMGPQAEFIHDMRSYYSEESRSLYGRYDSENRSYYSQEDRFDVDPERIQDRKFGSGFMEKDHRGGRQSDLRRGGDPIL